MRVTFSNLEKVETVYQQACFSWGWALLIYTFLTSFDVDCNWGRNVIRPNFSTILLLVKCNGPSEMALAQRLLQAGHSQNRHKPPPSFLSLSATSLQSAGGKRERKEVLKWLNSKPLTASPVLYALPKGFLAETLH